MISLLLCATLSAAPLPEVRIDWHPDRGSAPRALVPGGGPVSLRFAGAAPHLKMPAIRYRDAHWLAAPRVDGADLVVPVAPLPGPADDYRLVDLADSEEWAPAPQLIEDPKDRAPLGDRRMLVLVHHQVGMDNQHGAHSARKISVWNPLRESPALAAVQRRFKIYMFLYPTYRDSRENGAHLARMILAAQPGLGAGRLVLFGYSMGAQVARRAAAEADMRARTALIVTFAGPHHGSILASLLPANEQLVERVGRVWWDVLQLACHVEPDTPGMASLAWDNFDGSVRAADAERYGLRLNPELRAFNATDPNLDRLVCLHGDIRTLADKGPLWGVAEELVRRGAAAYDPYFGNIDPLVPLTSGTCEGRPHRTVLFPGLDHREIIARPEPWQEALRMLEELP